MLDNFTPDITDGSQSQAPVRTQIVTATGAITISAGVVFLTKAGVAVMTIAAPAVGMDGAMLVIVSSTAQAHTVTFATTGFNGGGAGSDVATFGGAIGDSMIIVAYDGDWLVVGNENVTLA